MVLGETLLGKLINFFPVSLKGRRFTDTFISFLAQSQMRILIILLKLPIKYEAH